METDLKDLRRELGGDKAGLVLKPVLVATVVTAGTLLTGTLGLPAAIAAGAAAAIGGDIKEVAKAVADFIQDGFNFDRKQQETMAKHPMAYMYALSSVR